MSKDTEDTHHRKPRSRGGTNDPKNLSRVATLRHRAFHYLFKNWTAEQIAEELNRKWIDPDYRMIAVKKDSRCDECWKGDGLA